MIVPQAPTANTPEGLQEIKETTPDPLAALRGLHEQGGSQLDEVFLPQIISPREFYPRVRFDFLVVKVKNAGHELVPICQAVQEQLHTKQADSAQVPALQRVGKAALTLLQAGVCDLYLHRALLSENHVHLTTTTGYVDLGTVNRDEGELHSVYTHMLAHLITQLTLQQFTWQAISEECREIRNYSLRPHAYRLPGAYTRTLAEIASNVLEGLFPDGFKTTHNEQVEALIRELNGRYKEYALNPNVCHQRIGGGMRFPPPKNELEILLRDLIFVEVAEAVEIIVPKQTTASTTGTDVNNNAN